MERLETYILHYTPLFDRKKNLTLNLRSKMLKIFFIQEFDKESLTTKQIKKLYNSSEFVWNSKISLFAHNLDYVFNFRQLTFSEISLIYKHRKALELISKSNCEYGLILEDDAIPVRNYDKKILNLLKKDLDWDVLFLGLGIGKKFIRKKLNKSFLLPNRLYILPPPSTNCTEAFLIKKEAAIKILSKFVDFTLPMDFEYAYLFKLLDLDVKIISSPIFYQGSKSFGFRKKKVFEETVRV